MRLCQCGNLTAASLLISEIPWDCSWYCSAMQERGNENRRDEGGRRTRKGCTSYRCLLKSVHVCSCVCSLCVCIFVPVHVCVHVYIHVCIHVYMFVCIQVYIHVCIHVYMYVCVHLCASTCMYMTDMTNLPIKIASHTRNDQEKKHILQKKILHASKHKVPVLLNKNSNFSSLKFLFHIFPSI